ncbi:hypothetical protein Leryth_012743 [Lithospermum erythrorhizon]|nr:hypothetical protein Leryth_012743 [Lithospermum erythrorhizon]
MNSSSGISLSFWVAELDSFHLSKAETAESMVVEATVDEFAAADIIIVEVLEGFRFWGVKHGRASYIIT